MNDLKMLFTKKMQGDLGISLFLEQFLTKQKIPPQSYISMEQIHGNTIAIVTELDQGSIISGIDGMVIEGSTIESTTTLLIRTADCLPIFLVDRTHSIYAALHAGWKGLHGQIIKEAIQVMESVGAKRKCIEVSIGPHIQSCCYSVSEERKNVFQDIHSRQVGNVYFLDLGKVAMSHMIEQGIIHDHIFHSEICTCCSNNEYFSHRRSMIQPQNHSKTGRQVGILAISRYN